MKESIRGRYIIWDFHGGDGLLGYDPMWFSWSVSTEKTTSCHKPEDHVMNSWNKIKDFILTIEMTGLHLQLYTISNEWNVRVW
jgi:hypothetical protein